MIRLIIDTDFGADCDDAGAIALACLFEKLGEAKLLGIGHNTLNEYGVEGIDVVCNQFGCSVPLGACRENAPKVSDNYAEKMVKKFGSRIRYGDMPSSVTLYRRLLSENSGVKLVGIGQANGLSALIDSPGDEWGGSGVELIAEHVDEVILMAGIFGAEKRYDLYGPTGEAEYNVAMDVPSMRNFLNKCPVPVTFADFLLGEGVKTLGFGDGSDPLSFAYREFCGGARDSWDLTAVLYAVRGEAEFVRHGGSVCVDAVGVTHFTPDGGKDGYLRPRFGSEHLRDTINGFFQTGGKV